MTANEVRHGNYVMYDGRFFQIDIIASEFPTLKTPEFGIGVVDWNNIHPVPLTEEILLKCGFSYSQPLTLWKLPNSNIIYEYDDEEEDSCNYYVHFYHDGEHLIIESSNEHGEVSNMKFKHIKHLHQLQNLYFAITGQKLEIKL